MTGEDSSETIKTKQQALSIAKTSWGEATVGDRRLKVSRGRNFWVVVREFRKGDPTQEALLISIATGEARPTSARIIEVHIP